MNNRTKKFLALGSIFTGAMIFGFIDNFLLVIAGELIDSHIANMFGFGTMASAGLGNAFSDVIGVMGQGTVAGILFKVFKGVDENIVPRWMNIVAGCFGIATGCILGLCPLWF